MVHNRKHINIDYQQVIRLVNVKVIFHFHNVGECKIIKLRDFSIIKRIQTKKDVPIDTSFYCYEGTLILSNYIQHP